MQVSSCRQAVPCALLLTQVVGICGMQNTSLSVVDIAPRLSNALDEINTEGNKDLEEWLDANRRMSTEVLKACPLQCSQAHNSTMGAGWSLIPDTSRLIKCNETMLLDLVIKNEDATAIRACTADYDADIKPVYQSAGDRAALCPTPNCDMLRRLCTNRQAFPEDTT